MNDSSSSVQVNGVHNLQPWYPPHRMPGPRNVDYVQTPPDSDKLTIRNQVPAPLTVPYYRYHLSPRFQQCAYGERPAACHNIYGDFLAYFEDDVLHGATRDEYNSYKGSHAAYTL